MGKIRQLDKQLANKIAAGEVIERPANVVKELVENSIDAKASAIEVYIEDGGLTRIQVSDNGEGMDQVDARLCLSTHATSKIKDDFDLFNITTLGFRGEALPSIASISHFELETSQGSQGYKGIYEFGDLVEETSGNAKRGTTIMVTKLFQNVPARLKYMKSIQAEFSHIQGFVEKFALANPQISFSLYHQSRLIFKTNGNGKLIEVIGQVYGFAVAKNMIHVDFSDDEFQVEGYVSKIDTTRASKANIITLINHRVVRNLMTIDAINLAYRDYLANDRFPIALVNIEIDPYLVDVNVHPAKMEVRFSKERQLKELVLNGVKEALSKQNLTYQAMNKETEKETYNKNYVQSTFDLASDQTYVKEEIHYDLPKGTSLINEDFIEENDELSYENSSSSFVVNETPIEKKDLFQSKEDLVQIQPELNIQPNEMEIKQEEAPRQIKKKIYAKAQIHGSYIVGENQEGFYLIDQHAAKERVNYEYYKRKFARFDATYQDLLVPLVFELPMSEYLIIQEKKDLLLEVGIELIEFGQNSFIVKKLPIWMHQINEKKYIDDMIEQILREDKVDRMVLQDHAIATLSCKASLKANTYLTLNDMQAILDDLMCCDNPYVCPHGRPTVIFYSSYELEKLFKRVV